MNPLTLKARCYRTFEELDLDLPDGCVAILGENGAGKSSVVDAIDLCIFGPESRSLADLQTEGVDEDLLLELELEHAGDRYRIRRTYSAHGRGKTTLDFEFWETRHPGGPSDDFWTTLTLESAKATQDLIERTLGLTRQTFRASAFLAQGDGAAFSEAQPRDRKRVLAEVLGLDRWDVLRARAAADVKAAASASLVIAGKTQAAQDLVDTKPTVEREQDDAVTAETVTADQVADREREHAAVGERWQQAREQASARAALVAERDQAQQTHLRLMERETQAIEATAAIAKATPELQALEALAARLPALMDAERAAAETLASWQQTSKEFARVEAERARLLELSKVALRKGAEVARNVGTAKCEHCGQTLGVEAAEVAAQSYADESIRHLATISELPVVEDPGPRPAGTVEDPEPARKAAVAAAALQERLAYLQTEAGGRPDPETLEAARVAYVEKRDALDAHPTVDIAAIEIEGRAAGEHLQQAKVAFDTARTQRVRLDERLAQIASAEQQIDEARAQLAALQADLDVAVALERAFSPNGIPALIIENTAIPYLETEANRILAELGAKTAECRIELRTQAALKSGDGLRDTLDVIVTSNTGERAYETFSGGERTRINLALRIALARLLAHRRGAESRLLVIDEPDGLDEKGMAALVRILQGLQGDFDKLYVVSHVPGLRDSFDTTLTVVAGDDGWSHVQTADVFAMVEA